MYRTGIGQDSHRFGEGGECIVGGVVFSDAPAMEADSDGDVVLHAICNAISSVTGVPILGGCAIEMCKAGERDSRAYVRQALKTLGGARLVHVALSVEGGRPRFQARAEEVRESVAKVCGLEMGQVGIAFTSGDGLTDFARGIGLQCFCVVTIEG